MSKLKKESGGSYKILKTTPFGNVLVKDFALQLIPKEQLGYDLVPDLLTVVFLFNGLSAVCIRGFFLWRWRILTCAWIKISQSCSSTSKAGLGLMISWFILTGLSSISYPADYLKEKYHMTAGIFNPESAIALLKIVSQYQITGRLTG